MSRYHFVPYENKQMPHCHFPSRTLNPPPASCVSMISNPLILCRPSQNKRTTGRGQTFACQQILERHMFQVETKAKQPPSCITFFFTITPQDTCNGDLVAHCQVISVQLASLLELLIAFPPLPAGHMHCQGSAGSTTARLTRWGSSGTTPAWPSAQSRSCRPFFLKPHWFGDVIQEKKEPVLSPLTDTEGEVGRGRAMTNTPRWLCTMSRAPANKGAQQLKTDVCVRVNTQVKAHGSWASFCFGWV